MSVIPRFAVVGHPNKGKSSIVATLSEDDSVAIASDPGTTTRSRRFPMKVDGRTLYELIDTPGFERARETLAWLEEHHPAAHQRAETVAAFVAAHASTDRFRHECELLSPLLESAGILYVVDGSKPYGPEYEAEMQVLRWTGRPRMALINMIGDGDFVDEWRRALDQFFAIVRVFDAVRADFDKRLSLLRAFGELDERWQPTLEEVIDTLKREREHRKRQVAAEVVDLLIDAVTRRVSKGIGEDDDPDAARPALLEKLLDGVRRRERQARDLIEAIYRHPALSRQEGEAGFLAQDLFSEDVWQVFGLSRRQLAATGAVSGAVAGGSVDILLGGSSLLLGATLGAALGGAGVFLGAEQLARTRVLGLPLGGRELIVGPVRDPNFPWVILGRALLHQRVVSERNHARREALILETGAETHVMDGIAGDVRRRVDRIVARIRRDGAADPTQRRALEDAIAPLLH